MQPTNTFGKLISLFTLAALSAMPGSTYARSLSAFIRDFEPKVKASGYRHRPGMAFGRGKVSHKQNA